jgi:hypothetical protein
MQQQLKAVEEAVGWMRSQLLISGSLYHSEVVELLLQRYPTLVRESDAGGYQLDARLLAAFRSATAKEAIWVRAEKAWLTRSSTDAEGRQA